jgi:hypothetical protein
VPPGSVRSLRRVGDPDGLGRGSRERVPKQFELAIEERLRHFGFRHNPVQSMEGARPGEPCKRPAMLGGNVCYGHGGNAPHVKAKAQRRLQQASDALDRVVEGPNVVQAYFVMNV